MTSLNDVDYFSGRKFADSIKLILTSSDVPRDIAHVVTRATHQRPDVVMTTRNTRRMRPSVL